MALNDCFAKAMADEAGYLLAQVMGLVRWAQGVAKAAVSSWLKTNFTAWAAGSGHVRTRLRPQRCGQSRRSPTAALVYGLRGNRPNGFGKRRAENSVVCSPSSTKKRRNLDLALTLTRRRRVNATFGMTCGSGSEPQ